MAGRLNASPADFGRGGEADRGLTCVVTSTLVMVAVVRLWPASGLVKLAHAIGVAGWEAADLMRIRLRLVKAERSAKQYALQQSFVGNCVRAMASTSAQDLSGRSDSPNRSRIASNEQPNSRAWRINASRSWVTWQ